MPAYAAETASSNLCLLLFSTSLLLYSFVPPLLLLSSLFLYFVFFLCMSSFPFLFSSLLSLSPLHLFLSPSLLQQSLPVSHPATLALLSYRFFNLLRSPRCIPLLMGAPYCSTIPPCAFCSQDLSDCDFSFLCLPLYFPLISSFLGLLLPASK